MFTSKEIIRAWFKLYDQGKVDSDGYINMKTVLKFLDKKFDEIYMTDREWDQVDKNDGGIND